MKNTLMGLTVVLAGLSWSVAPRAEAADKASSEFATVAREDDDLVAVELVGLDEHGTVAAPIVGDEVQMINIGWRFSQNALKQALNIKRLQVVNDFAARWVDERFRGVLEATVAQVAGVPLEPGAPRFADFEA